MIFAKRNAAMKIYTAKNYKMKIRKHGEKFCVDGEIYTVGQDNFIPINSDGKFCLPKTLVPLENQDLGRFAASGIIPQWIADDTKTRESAR